MRSADVSPSPSRSAHPLAGPVDAPEATGIGDGPTGCGPGSEPGPPSTRRACRTGDSGCARRARDPRILSPGRSTPPRQPGRPSTVNQDANARGGDARRGSDRLATASAPIGDGPTGCGPGSEPGPPSTRPGQRPSPGGPILGEDEIGGRFALAVAIRASSRRAGRNVRRSHPRRGSDRLATASAPIGDGPTGCGPGRSLAARRDPPPRPGPTARSRLPARRAQPLSPVRQARRAGTRRRIPASRQGYPSVS
jgi:hypothetical protein